MLIPPSQPSECEPQRTLNIVHATGLYTWTFKLISSCFVIIALALFFLIQNTALRNYKIYTIQDIDDIENKDHQRMMVDLMFMIVLNSRSFLTAVT